MNIYKEHLKKLINIYQTRVTEYKSLFKDIHINKTVFEQDDFYKSFLRELKNEDEKVLKELVSELTYYKQGLNPPFCYGKEKKKPEKKDHN